MSLLFNFLLLLGCFSVVLFAFTNIFIDLIFLVCLFLIVRYWKVISSSFPILFHHIDIKKTMVNSPLIHHPLLFGICQCEFSAKLVASLH
jgi:hypothetical protein